MKTVLVLTDFSSNANHAAETAVFLAGKLNLNVLLFNIYFSVPGVPAGENDAWSKTYEVFKKESEDNLQKEVERLSNKITPGLPKPVIQYLTAFGHLGTKVNSLISDNNNNNIDFIVMGARKKLQSFKLFGDDINDVVKNSDKPVLIVNESLNFKEIKNIVFTTDVADSDLQALAFLNKLSNSFNFKVHATYVSPVSEFTDLEEEQKVSHYLEGINQIGSPNISFENLKGEDVINELVKFNTSIAADLLAIVHKNRSFLWRLFHESVSKEFTKDSTISILIIPEQ
ncbi:nucleotide-binding universal stress UspA family protein [Pedobacter sp. CG_S7]|uniref:universal stress protein n=1 Tax=Pedobacter sp. CG_S7 TaxID=3143930 RepID=UPI00339AB1D7